MARQTATPVAVSTSGGYSVRACLQTRVNDPKIHKMWYIEEQRTMCESAGSFAWPGKKPGQHAGKAAVEFVADTYTKLLVGVGTSQVVSILEDLVRA